MWTVRFGTTTIDGVELDITGANAGRTGGVGRHSKEEIVDWVILHLNGVVFFSRAID
jgi:hypothetical protein